MAKDITLAIVPPVVVAIIVMTLFVLLYFLFFKKRNRVELQGPPLQKPSNDSALVKSAIDASVESRETRYPREDESGTASSRLPQQETIDSCTDATEKLQPKETPIFKIATVNLFSVGSQDPNKSLYMLIAGLQNTKPDVVVIQETPAWIQTPQKVPGYTLAYIEAAPLKGPGETLACLVADDSVWKLDNNKIYGTQHCKTGRVTVQSTFRHKQHNNIQVQVGNVHLCGGRNDEATVPESLDRINILKTELLQKYDPKPDVILGDFNSDINHFINPENPNPQQWTFLEMNKWSKELMLAWNSAPFKWMQESNYMYIPPLKQTSFFGSTPDSIWYQPTVLTPVEDGAGFIDMGAINGVSQTHGGSDHNGVFATFRVSTRSTNLGQK